MLMVIQGGTLIHLYRLNKAIYLLMNCHGISTNHEEMENNLKKSVNSDCTHNDKVNKNIHSVISFKCMGLLIF